MRTDEEEKEVHFVTFGDSVCFRHSLRRIGQQAFQMRVFQKIWTLSEHHLERSFWDAHGPFIRAHRRGYGYWIWKPQVILQTLHACPPGAAIVYADSGCELNANGRSRLLEYVRLARSHPMGILTFRLSPPEKHYTKADTIHHVFPEVDQESEQVMATASVWIACPPAMAFAEEWLAQCVRDGGHLVTDAPSVLPNDPSFVAHRHDQSIFSLLVKKHGVLTIADETFGQRNDAPIRAARIRH